MKISVGEFFSSFLSLNHPLEGFISFHSSSRSLGYLCLAGRLDGAEQK